MPEGFFQTQAKLAAIPAASAPPPQTVSQLTARIDKAIKTGLPGNVLVKGEISNFKPHHGSGHFYFTLKDPGACIDCVMWKDAARSLKFQPADGLEVIASGRVAVYAERGKYQLYANTLSPVGQGALELAFRQLRDKLQKEGLFAPERKKPLPKYPRRIVLMTSAATAALQDMLKVLRRFAWLKLSLFDVPVQGDGAAEKIAAAIAHLSRQDATAIDVILLARGGGSLEDLWAFNEEIVARAIAASRLPIVTGIGHEVDVSIADLVADYHAHTPTEAAQIVTAHWRHAPDLLRSNHQRLCRGLLQIVESSRHRLLHILRHEFFRRPRDLLNTRRQMLDDRQRLLTLRVSDRVRRSSTSLNRLEMRLLTRHPRHTMALENSRLSAFERSLARAMRDYLHRRQLQLDGLSKHLQAISPDQVLLRGYTMTLRKNDGQPIRRAADVKIGETLVTRFPDGTAESVATDPRQPRLF
ncbi:MAG TPA: exodeoxyribonuclease VII large subunit [Tepidisphaeraceae bacterium]|nr:exodeoxyribonuclease VII large subunit [Tepidisphaeraceae bacterium]